MKRMKWTLLLPMLATAFLLGSCASTEYTGEAVRQPSSAEGYRSKDQGNEEGQAPARRFLNPKILHDY